MKQPCINDVFVSVEPSTGTLRRYAGGVMSHEAIANEGVTFTPAMVEEFRVRPLSEFALPSAFHPLPTPPSGTPQAVAA